MSTTTKALQCTRSSICGRTLLCLSRKVEKWNVVSRAWITKWSSGTRAWLELITDACPFFYRLTTSRIVRMSWTESKKRVAGSFTRMALVSLESLASEIFGTRVLETAALRFCEIRGHFGTKSTFSSLKLLNYAYFNLCIRCFKLEWIKHKW